MMSIELCKVLDRDAQNYKNLAESAGYKVLRGRLFPDSPSESWYVNVLTEGNAFASPNSEFKRVPSGTYAFRHETLVRLDT